MPRKTNKYLAIMNTEKVTNHIVNWLKDYATKAGMKGFVVGVSGGIDSAVTSTFVPEQDWRYLPGNAYSSGCIPSESEL